MDLQNINYTVEDGIGTIVLDRPKALNALNTATLMELDQVLDDAFGDEEVRVLILTGGGEKAFVAGADIKELSDLSPLEANEHAQMGQALFDKLEQLGKPTIAAVNGFALGGGLELALACTVRLASSNARMGLPEITLGLIPGFGGTQRLPRLIGMGRAMHMVLTGKPIAAETALQYGLVSEVTEPGELMGAAKKLAGLLMNYSAVTLRLAEETIRGGLQMAMHDAVAFEAAQFGVAVSTEDAREGMAAFMEKRKAEFKNQ